MYRLYLYGAGGHGKVVAEIAEAGSFPVSAFIDPHKAPGRVWDYPIVEDVPKGDFYCVVSIGDNRIRAKIVSQHPDLKYDKLIHPYTNVSHRAFIGEGSVLMAGVSINSSAYIGKHCIINTNASVDHDCVLKDYVHISPNVGLAGNVKVGEGTHIGIGANVIQGITIGKWCTIGAGAVIIRDVPDGATVVGNPGRVLPSSSK